MATKADIDAIYRLLCEGDVERPEGCAPMDPVSTMLWVATVVAQEMTCVAEIDGEIRGTGALDMKAWPWNQNEQFMAESWLFVDPLYRKGKTAVSIIKKMLSIAEKKGGLVFMGSAFGDRTKAKDRLHSMQGLKYLGGNFTKEFKRI